MIEMYLFMQFMEVTVAMLYGPPMVPNLHLNYVNLNRLGGERKKKQEENMSNFKIPCFVSRPILPSPK